MSGFQDREYTFGDLIKDDLTLPPIVKDTQSGVTEKADRFSLVGFPSEPNDIRNIGRGILQILAPLMVQNSPESIKPGQFREFIERAETFSNEDSLTYMILAEQLLRTSETYIDLKDVKSYPLFIWFLIMNLPQESADNGDQESVPFLSILNEQQQKLLNAAAEAP